MTKRTKKSGVKVAIPSDLDAASVVAVHQDLLALLEKTGGGAAVAEVELAKADSVAPLSLQLLVSAAKTFPEKQVRFGANATAALATLEPAKEN